MANPPVDELVPGFDEFAVVEAARSGAHDALSALYEHYFPKVYRYVAARLGNSEDAEDVTEEIFLRVIHSVGSFSWRGLPVGAWVCRIARNEVVSHVRRQKTRGGTAQLSDSIADSRQDHVALVETQLTMEEVRRAAEKLPEAQRQVIALRFGSGLSVSETAQALGKTENNVKVLQHKAIARLQQLVGRR
ncbi:MAG: sigma-70 family RNA polymerase sigma factor [Dehalococcoidia bacterium]|nr:sigma-70 family RNA polymerase sigma factor [Dehalococcoidia bacterium]